MTVLTVRVFPQRIVQSIIFGVVCLSSTVSYAQQSEQSEDAIEVIKILGQRHQYRTEPTPETQKLLKVAGIDGDPLAAVFSLPGVIYAGSDLGGEPAVRGSSPDDNAFLIDGMPADYIFHLFGDSIFNKNLIQDFDFQAASFGAEYGGAIGGVFDVRLRDPRNQPITSTLDLSLLRAGFLVEGGITESQSFYASYRRSLMHLFVQEDAEEDGIRVFEAPQSDDYQVKYLWQIDHRQRIMVSANGASDSGAISISQLSEEGRADPDIVGDARVDNAFDAQGLQYEFHTKLFLLHAAINNVKTINRESFGAGQFADISNQQQNLRVKSTFAGINNHRLTAGIDWQRNDFGYDYDLINYNCTDITPDCDNRRGDRVQGNDSIDVDILAAYIIEQWQIVPQWSFELGLRAERDNYTRQSYLHPRIKTNVNINDKLNVFASAGRYSRFPNIDEALPQIGNRNLSPFLATHFTTGADLTLNNLWAAKIEFYTKSLDDLSRATDEFSPDPSLNYTNDVSGKAQGVELLVTRELANGWYGWASLSVSKSERRDDLTKTKTAYYLDTPWVLNVVGNYEFSDKWELSARLTARAGARYTPIDSLQINPNFPDNFLPVYGELNSDTLPTYYRLDIQASYSALPFGLDGAWTFALINALGNRNVFGYYYAPDGSESLQNVPIDKDEGIGIFPSIGVQINF